MEMSLRAVPRWPVCLWGKSDPDHGKSICGEVFESDRSIGEANLMNQTHKKNASGRP
jgi:hypothetical protein